MTLLTRRVLLTALSLAGAMRSLPAAADRAAGKLERDLADLETRHGGRLGVAILDAGNGKMAAHRGQERFALCSTHKVLSTGLVLRRVDRRQENLDRRVVYSREILVPYSPVTEKHSGGDGLSIGEICDAALTLSDNTAANLLLDSVGGPQALTAYLRALGDGVTRLDRREPALNDVEPGDPRDTTTPIAMAETVGKLILGAELSEVSRTRLANWLVACKTGGARLRAGMPKAWRIGDKTGSGPKNETNDVAIVWPPGRAPVVIATYYAGSGAAEDERNAVLAEVGGIAAALSSRRHVQFGRDLH